MILIDRLLIIGDEGMRLVAVKDLKGNEIIGENIIRDNGVVLLNKGTRFRLSFAEKLLQYKIEMIYIEDKLSEGIIPMPVIEPEQKKQLIEDFRCEFDKVLKNKIVKLEPIYKIADGIVEALVAKQAIYDLINVRTNAYNTYEHSIEVTILVYMMCKKLMIPVNQTRDIVVGSLLHDIGMIFVPKEILEKTTKLTEEERKTIQNHSEMGYCMIKDDNTISALAKLIVLCHHEREDGSGYPLGKGEDLHIGAKIVAACDIFVAITSERCYREGLSLNEAIILLRKEKLNEKVEKTLESMLNFYPVGSAVLLSNNAIAIVEKNYSEDLNRPSVRVVMESGMMLDNYYKINLLEEKSVSIVKIVNI